MFEAHCIPRKNVPSERCMLRKKIQNEKETTAESVTDLILESLSCDYGILKDSLVNYQIVLRCNKSNVNGH